MRLKISMSFFLAFTLVSLTACAGNTATESSDGAGAAAGREEIGAWREEGPDGSTITIYREGGSVFMETVDGEGNSETLEMVESSLPTSTRFDRADERGGGYYIINRDGDLRRWGPDGPSLTARRIE